MTDTASYGFRYVVAGHTQGSCVGYRSITAAAAAIARSVPERVRPVASDVRMLAVGESLVLERMAKGKIREIERVA